MPSNQQTTCQNANNGLIPEWQPQSAVLIAWPDRLTDFAATLNAVEQTYLAIVQAITLHQSLIIAVRNQQLKNHVRQLLSQESINRQQVVYCIIDYDDIWVRDIAPLGIRHNNSVYLLRFRFNAWGNQYQHSKDALFAQRLLESGIFHAPSKTSELTLEGGALDSNSLGDVLTTESCLFDQNRNQKPSHQLTSDLIKTIHATRLIVLRNGRLIGDDTGGHIDTLVRFCSDQNIVYTACDNPKDPNYNELLKLQDEISELNLKYNSQFNCCAVPIPDPIFNVHNQQLPASYINFLIINHAVLVPQYNDKKDELALQILQSCFPDRQILPIPCLSLIQQFGSLHCMTMNYPSAIQLHAI
ncbi:MAG: agmatine deiminase family protein [Gammaproteobacteria bacterium]|nr:agmatine deiminase family protein [Gammaproteobacteria bacterium]